MKNRNSLLRLDQNDTYIGQLSGWQITLLYYREYCCEKERVGRGNRLYRE